MVMIFHSFLSREALSMMLLLSCLFPNLSLSHSRSVFLCHPLARFPSILPTKIAHSERPVLQKWAGNESCLLQVTLSNALFIPALSKTSSLLVLCSILRRNHISAALNLPSVFLFIVQLSQPCNRDDHTWLVNVLILVCMLILSCYVMSLDRSAVVRVL